MTDMILTFLEGQDWWVWVAGAIAAASAFTAVTPTPEEGSRAAKIYAVIDFLALNVLRAKDTGDKKVEAPAEEK